MRNNQRMHNTYNPELAAHTTHRNTPAPDPHQSSALHVQFPQRWITTPMSGPAPVPGLALHRHPHCAPTDHARLQICSANINMFLHNLSGSPHRRRIVMIRDCMVQLPTSSALLALGVMWKNAVQSSVAGRTPRHHKVSCSASLPVGKASM